MDIRCLGRLEAAVDGVPADLGGSQQKHVLAILVSRARGSVSTDAIVNDLWPDTAPDTARKTVQGYISALRRVLPQDSIESTPAGYTLAVDVETIDATRFEARVTEASVLSPEDAGRGAEILRDALSEWRGTPYDGISESDILRPEIVRLEEIHASAQESLAEADLFTGRDTSVVAELADLTRAEPLRERRWALWALALYRTGRQTEALRVYEDARRTLATEAGLDPSNELRTLEQRILDQDPILDGYDALNPLASGAPGQRRNPYKGLRPFGENDAADYFGRNALVRRLTEAVTVRGTPRLHVVAGPSGSGKSSVVGAGLTPALRAAGREVRTEFPDVDALAPGDDVDVLIVDQFEEIFAADEDTSYRYLDSLTDLVE